MWAASLSPRREPGTPKGEIRARRNHNFSRNSFSTTRFAGAVFIVIIIILFFAAEKTVTFPNPTWGKHFKGSAEETAPAAR